MFWWSATLFAGFRFSRRVLVPNPVETLGMSVFKFALVFTPCQCTGSSFCFCCPGHTHPKLFTFCNLDFILDYHLRWFNMSLLSVSSFLLLFCLDHCFSNCSCGGTPKTIVYIPRNPCLLKRKKKLKKLFLAHGDYSSISNFRTKLLAKFRGAFIIFFRYFKISTYLFHWFPRNPKHCSVEL
jgi:hypothetical protein